MSPDLFVTKRLADNLVDHRSEAQRHLAVGIVILGLLRELIGSYELMRKS